jgi:hypothetical protein
VTVSTRAALQAVIEEVIAGRIDVLDWWRAMAEKLNPGGNADAKTMKTLAYKATPEYLEWLLKVASKNRTNIPTMIDQSVAKYARDIGVADVPPDRTA